MAVNQKDNFGLEKDSDGLLNNNQSINAGDWRFGNQPQPPMSLDLGSQIGVVDSFCPNIWDHSSNSLSAGFSNAGPATNNVPVSKPLPESSRVDMGWNHTDYTSKGAFLQPGLGVFPPGQPEFPADSAFIERAAKYSCFGSGNYGGMMNSFGINEFLSPYSDASRAAMVTPRDQSQKNEATIKEANKNRARSPTQSRKGIGSSDGNEEATEAEFGGSGPDETPKTLTARKRKRPAPQDAEFDPPKDEPVDHVQTPKDNSGSQSKDDQKKSTSDTTKQSGKNVKDGNDATKEDYIHVRARRGQATNSHSLAERVRREKISERMKFLQDLVPSCSKVTGKAVMLDEIINYVQSLQRQVEFLSMKLSTVNPHLDVNIEGIFSKDILQSHAGSSSGLGFSPDSLHPFLQNSQGLVHPGFPGVGGPTDMLRRAINAQLTSMNTYKESKHQVHNAWDDELQDVLSQVGLDRNLPLNIQDSTDKSREGFPL